MTPATITLDEALALLSLPRSLGDDAAGNEVTALERPLRAVPQGRHRDALAARRAVAVHASPSTRRSRCSPSRSSAAGAPAAAPLRELGDDPASAASRSTLRKGRFGPYVTDGETNASLRTGDDPETITVERAAELLQDRRDRGPSTRPTRRGCEEGDRQEGRPRRRRPPRRPARRRRPRRRRREEGGGDEEGRGERRPAALADGERRDGRGDHGRRADAVVTAAEALHRLRGHRRLREVHPGATRRGRARGARDLRAR